MRPEATSLTTATHRSLGKPPLTFTVSRAQFWVVSNDVNDDYDGDDSFLLVHYLQETEAITTYDL